MLVSEMRKLLIGCVSSRSLLVFYALLYPTFAHAITNVPVNGDSANYFFNFEQNGASLMMKPGGRPPSFPQGGDDKIRGSITFAFKDPAAFPPPVNLTFSINDATEDDGQGLMDGNIPAGFELLNQAPVQNNLTAQRNPSTHDVPAPLPLLGVGVFFRFARRLRKISREVKLITTD
jgi:hypothetical protein